MALRAKFRPDEAESDGFVPALSALDARRARFEGRHIGRRPLELDHTTILRDRQHKQSLGQLARTYCVSRAAIHRVLHGGQAA
jgi:hypothetical protein